jgi:peroxiredoxin Q/BCP
MPNPVELSVGDPAPAINATATGDGEFLLAEHLGTWVVVYFYPRANTPG